MLKFMTTLELLGICLVGTTHIWVMEPRRAERSESRRAASEIEISVALAPARSTRSLQSASAAPRSHPGATPTRMPTLALTSAPGGMTQAATILHSTDPGVSDDSPGAVMGVLEETVRRAMLRLYIHGVDEKLARSVLGAESVPILRKLLFDPAFPRRDNVVAFLGHLDQGEAAADLMSFLARAPVFPFSPEEDRALLTAPRALGRMAGRGDTAALEALLAITSGEAWGEPHQAGECAASGLQDESSVQGWPYDPASLGADLRETAMDGLAFSGAEEARRRLVEISQGLVLPGSGGRDLAPVARESLEIFDLLAGGVPQAQVRELRLDSALDPSSPSRLIAGPTSSSTESFDTHSRVHEAGMTFANHPDVFGPMTEERLDQVLRLASTKAGREDFEEDIACCITVARSGSGGSFGETGDGLDIITTEEDFMTVQSNRSARAKVVRYIGRCGGVVDNWIGCAWGTDSFVIVRLSTGLGEEAVLWLHEYGHNTGLPHNGANAAYVMYPWIHGDSGALTELDCDSYHAPAAGGVSDIGACIDEDVDNTHDLIDNCSDLPNATQYDYDRDTLGDLCDNCFAAPNLDQIDANSNGRGDACDVTILEPVEQASVACDEASQPPSIQWTPGVYDRFRVFISSDADFKRPKITSGRKLLTATGWTPPLRKWLSLCRGSSPRLYIKVLGLDREAQRKNVDRQISSEVITVLVPTGTSY